MDSGCRSINDLTLVARMLKPRRSTDVQQQSSMKNVINSMMSMLWSKTPLNCEGLWPGSVARFTRGQLLHYLCTLMYSLSQCHRCENLKKGLNKELMDHSFSDRKVRNLLFILPSQAAERNDESKSSPTNIPLPWPFH